MQTQQPTIDEAVEAELCDCVSCLTVPLSVLALEVDVPLGGWDGMLEQLEIRQVVDHLGRKAIAAISARRLLQMRKRQGEKAAEDRARHSARLAAKRPVTVGLPAVEGATPYESLIAAGIVTPDQEFGKGRDKPRFLQEALKASARENAEKKAQAAERKKARLADEMKDKLGGRR